MAAPKEVAIVYRYVPHYRVEFYELLRQLLATRGIGLTLIYGDPGGQDAVKEDNVEIDWGIKIKNRIWRLGRYELYWQPALKYARDADLVVVESASRLLLNYPLLIRYWLGNHKFAYWGHGRNFQDISASRAGEWIKRLLSNQVHWWFVYNELGARILRERRFASNRITCVQNAIDTRGLTELMLQHTQEQRQATRLELGIHSENVAIYSGGIYSEKRIEFLLSALKHIRLAVKDFEMIFIGSGSDAGLVQDAAREHSWIHFVGPQFDINKVAYFALSRLLLMPGLVGLAILDAFALETPLVTTNISYHSPEIAYLVNGDNGIMLPDSGTPESYAAAVIDLLTNEARRQGLIGGCRAARQKYTVEAMAERFAEGVELALRHP